MPAAQSKSRLRLMGGTAIGFFEAMQAKADVRPDGKAYPFAVPSALAVAEGISPARLRASLVTTGPTSS